MEGRKCGSAGFPAGHPTSRLEGAGTKKLKLNVDDLAVTSFIAEADTAQRCTVYGRDSYGTDFQCGTWEYNCTDPTTG